VVRPLVASGVNCPSTREKIPEEVPFHPHLTFRAKVGGPSRIRPAGGALGMVTPELCTVAMAVGDENPEGVAIHIDEPTTHCGVGEAGSVDFSSAFDLAGEIGGLVDADLELAAEADALVGKGEVGTAAGTGEEALHLGEGFDLLLGSEGKLCHNGVTLPEIRCK